MKILMLGPTRQNIVRYLHARGDEVVSREGKIAGDSTILDGVDFIISYGYRYIVKGDVLSRFPGRVINLHISYLPWNRGADPNLWSFLEDTPKGVTIHYMDVGVDTGEIIAQREITWTPDDTLKTTYERLTITIEDLFKELWPDIRSGNIKSITQPVHGSSHRLKDKVPYESLLHSGWDTPVGGLIGKARTMEARGD